MGLADRLHRLALSRGLEIRRLSRANSPIARRMALLDELGIDCVLDVGANTGQYGLSLRAAGYDGRIVSFEPLAEPFGALTRAATADPNWEPLQLALGADPGDFEIQVAGNLASSSMLPMSKRHTDAAPESAPVGSERISVVTLDERAPQLLSGATSTFLKLDVQGFELQVLRGGTQTLPKIAGVECELSLVELYDGQPLLPEVYGHLSAAGFECVALNPGFSDRRSGRMLQVDGLFARS